MDLIKQFKNFINNLNNEDKIGLIYHNDADGITSGVILAKALKRYKNIEIKYLIPPDKDYDIKDEFILDLKRKKINKLIIVDMSLDKEKIQLEKISRFSDILIIDHHPKNNQITNNKITIIKSEDITKKYYPCAKLVYDLFNNLVEITDLDWISCIGIIGDMGYKPWKDFVNKTLKKYNEPVPNQIMKTKLSKLVGYITAATCCDYKNLNQTFNKVYNAKNMNELLNSDLKKYKIQFSKELNYWLNKHTEAKEILKDLYLLKITPKYNMNSPISTAMSLKYFFNKTLIIISEYPNEKKLHISLRRQDQKIDMGQLIKDMHKKSEFIKGGGHAPAAGGSLPKNKFKHFEKILKETYKELLSQTPQN